MAVINQFSFGFDQVVGSLSVSASTVKVGINLITNCIKTFSATVSFTMDVVFVAVDIPHLSKRF